MSCAERLVQGEGSINVDYVIIILNKLLTILTLTNSGARVLSLILSLLRAGSRRTGSCQLQHTFPFLSHCLG